MPGFDWLATPFWINLLFFVPVFLWVYFRKSKLDLANKLLFQTAIFGIAFGFIESAVVIYLRAATGLLPGFEGTLADVWQQSIGIYNQELLLRELPISLLTVELIREFGTMIMLISVAVIAVKQLKERIAVFLWIFAFWDVFYYVFLYLTVRWPEGLRTKDVLFLIPEPWFGEVWMPIGISIAAIFVIFFNRKRGTKA